MKKHQLATNIRSLVSSICGGQTLADVKSAKGTDARHHESRNTPQLFRRISRSDSTLHEPHGVFPGLHLVSTQGTSAPRAKLRNSLCLGLRTLRESLARPLCLLVFFTGAVFANVCTPLTAPANGPFPAVPANGIDGVSWSVARVMWTSDFSPSAATQQQVQYATATEWAANPGIYPHVTGQAAQTPASSTTIQSAILSNLLPNTLYHVLAQSYQGNAWCTATDQTFATLAKPAEPIKAQLPVPVDTTRPAMNGTHWVYGSNCGTTTSNPRGTWSATTAYATGDSVTLTSFPNMVYWARQPSTNQPPNGENSLYWSPLVTLNLQDCLNKMNTANGDDLGLPPGTYPITQAFLHNSEKAVNVSCSTVDSYCTQSSGAAPANGTKVIFGSQQYGTVPSPINPGVPYKIINASGSRFQVSYDGVTALTLLNNGSNPQYLLWPLTQPKSVIHSTAAANLLPPPGVRLGPDALAQYYPYMPNLQAEDPAILTNGGNGILTFLPLTENLTIENIRFSVDPTVATASSVTDPVAFLFPINTGGFANTGITWDQVALDPGPAPSRIIGTNFEGVNIAWVNSYAAIDFWAPHYYATTLWSVTSNTISLPPSTFSYVGSNGKKVSCPNAGGTMTISGSVSGSIALWVDANCTWEAQLTTGLTATSTVPGMIISNAATPAYPTTTYNTVLGYSVTTHAALPFYILTVNAGSIVNDLSYNFFDPGASSQSRESSAGFSMDAYGPFKFDNNYISGGGVAGVFLAEGATLGTTVCGYINPCPIQTTIGNLTVTRNTITTNPDKFFYDSPNWDGGNRYWRNFNENKAGRYSLFDGNIMGPWSGQVGQGQCALHESFATSFIQIGNYPPYGDASDWTFTNNTCMNTPTGLATNYGFVGYVMYPYPIKNFYIHNNLFLNNNAYAQVAQNQPFRSNGHIMPDRTLGGNCAEGTMLTWVNGENFLVDHNTVSGMGGCQPYTVVFDKDLNSGGFTNNILNLVYDPGPWSAFLANGAGFDPESYLGGPCATAHVQFSCINDFQWAGNVMLATWKDSYPASQVEFGASDIALAQTYLPSYGLSWPNANTLAGRQAQIGWFNVSTNDFRLSASSPYISGNQRNTPSPTTDGTSVGANMEQLLVHQGNVSNVRVLSSTSTSFTLGFYAPDSFACGVDYGTTPFYNGSGSWTRVAGAAGSVDPRVQSVTITGLQPGTLMYYRINCAVQQPTGTVQLPTH